MKAIFKRANVDGFAGPSAAHWPIANQADWTALLPDK